MAGSGRGWPVVLLIQRHHDLEIPCSQGVCVFKKLSLRIFSNYRLHSILFCLVSGVREFVFLLKSTRKKQIKKW